MEYLFRFVLVRPPSALREEDVISLERESALQAELERAVQQESPGAAMRAVARQYTRGPEYVDRVERLKLGAPLVQLQQRLSSPGKLNMRQVSEAVRAVFRRSAERVAESPEFQEDWVRAADSLIAMKLLRSEQAKPAHRLARAVQLMALIRGLPKGDSAQQDQRSPAKLLRRPLQLPRNLFPIPAKRIRADAPKEIPFEESEQGRRLAAARAEAERLQAAIEELLRLESTDLVTSPAQEPVRPSAQKQERTTAVERPVRTPRPVPQVPAPAPESLFTLTEAAAGRLSKSTRETLRAAELDPQRLAVDRVVERLRGQLESTLRTVASLEPRTKQTVTQIGSNFTLVPGPIYIPTLPPASPAVVPTSHGEVAPAGVGDLLMVQQELKRYQAKEVAHIENVLKGELKLREHVRTETTEEIFFSETESSTEEERELESTDRFEIQRESEETIKEQAKLETGLKVSGKYGPVVEFEASVNGSLENSKERSTSFASTFASDVTSRASSKVTEKFKEQITRRYVQEVTETNKHELNNVGGTDHVVGVYQWVEKIYEAQVWNYGLRTMYDFMVPEPAAFLIAALKNKHAQATELEKPEEFTLQPNQITESNYHTYVLKYQATGVEAPPEPYLTLAKTFKGGPKEDGIFVEAAELPISDGYEAYYGYARLTGVNSWESNWTTDVSIGRYGHRFEDGVSFGWGVNLSNETGSIPVGLETWGIANYTLALEVKCRRTDRAMTDWQLKTHAAILEAYQQRLSEYEEKLAALEAAAGVEIAGRNPDINRKLEQDELKKHCITLLSAQHYDLFGAVEDGANGLPQVDLDQAAEEGKYIRFFEQAFEWENMTYVLYPYFWARKDQWVEKINYADVDPEFEAFLKAGSARVVVPVRPGFELAVDHFMNTGETWSGGELPTISSELYLPIVEELAEQLGAPGNEVAQGDPWDVTVPTSLVILRSDGSLPSWKKNEDGEWVPE